MSQDSECEGKRPTPSRWFQFSLRTVFWTMVTLAVACGWLSDRMKLKEQLAQERAEKEGLRIARDYDEQEMGFVNPWGAVIDSGWHQPLFATNYEADEATVEHLKEY